MEKNCVATSIKEITEDTIVYIGNLHVYEVLPTYNLKYIYGDIKYNLSKIHNLENLEAIYGNADFGKIERAEGLENLEEINGNVNFNSLEGSEELEILEKKDIESSISLIKSSKTKKEIDSVYYSIFRKIYGLSVFRNIKGIFKIKEIEFFENIFKDKSNFSQFILNAIEKSQLSVSLLKYFYGIDSIQNAHEKILEKYDFYEYLKRFNELYFNFISHRNNFDDFKKIYGEGSIATSIDEITKDTKVFIGNLEINEQLPTNNLEYIYGDLKYNLETVCNLEKLQVIFGSANFNKLISAKGLDNLTFIAKDAQFRKIKSAIGLEKLSVVKGALILSSIITSKGLENLEYIDGYSDFNNLEDGSFLVNLKFIGQSDFHNLRKSDGLSNLKYILGDVDFYSLEDSSSLTSLKCIFGDAYFNSLYDTSGLKKLNHINGNYYFDSVFDKKTCDKIEKKFR